MENDLLPEITSLLKIIWFLFSHGGWVVFVLLVIWILYRLYLDEIQGQYLSTVDWTLLEIKPPKENATSFFSAEQVFIQLHQLYDNFTFQEKYLEGRIVFTISFEIISLGGKISYLVRVPTKQRDLIEAALYANYPSMELTEVQDYLNNFHYDPEDQKYDLFGAEFVLVKDQTLPIRTWREFESLHGPETSDIVVDPLSPLFETFTKISDQEFYGVQYILQPVMDGSWQEEAEAAVEKLKGEKEIMSLDPITQDQIKAIKQKVGRPGYRTKIRLLHLGTKEFFNKNAKKLVLSPFRIFGSANYNGFKPAYGPKKDYRISPSLEEPYINWWVKRRKKNLFDGYKSRSQYIGEKTFILNAEELATVFHFPVTKTSISQPVESLESKKISPPANLPI